ncbi:MAG: SpoIIE family protein phosphatase [Myxococcota bacterium]|jgi:sigma-B regulation protein RsbU (phosphoserine phosphatase)|nr:SpoIIE family protein phosphatase [Myxococcota bacterium]
MTLDEWLALPDAPEQVELSPSDMRRLFWKYRGLLKTREREHAYWSATNDNLFRAYEKLDHQEQQLAEAFSRLEEELAVAKQIQSALMPSGLDELAPQLELAVWHQQLNAVGGDYFDFFAPTHADAQLLCAVCDISGHGVSAALVMAYLKALFTQSLPHSDEPRAVTEWLNQVALPFLKQAKKYATINFVRIREQELDYVCGGGFGLLIHGQECTSFNRKDHFIGLRDRPFSQHTLPFVAGDLLALYTDGIIEAQNSDGQDYSLARLERTLLAHATLPLDQILERCKADYHSFRSHDVDDITLVLLRRRQR